MEPTEHTDITTFKFTDGSIMSKCNNIGCDYGLGHYYQVGFSLDTLYKNYHSDQKIKDKDKE